MTIRSSLSNVRTESHQQSVTEDIPPSSNDLKKLAEGEKHSRHQKFQNALNWLVIIALWLIFASVVICGLSYLAHMILPKKWHYLDIEQLEQIRTFVVTAILSSSLTNYANRNINEEN